MRKVLIVLAILASGWPAARALAQGHAREHVRAGDVQPLDRILPEIRRNHPGSFYDAEGPFPDGGGGYRYRLKWLTPDGRVVWFDTDARTGRVLNADRFRENGDDRDRRRFDGRDRHDGPTPPRYRFRDDEGRDKFYDNRRNDWPGGGERRGGRGDWGGHGPGGHRGRGGPGGH